VLSVNTALSIQAHPNRARAADLHAARPDVYKDPNHKPELICALEPFVGMCGFRPYDEIAGYLSTVPELRALLGEAACTAFEAAPAADGALKALFTRLMTSGDDTAAVAAALQKLKARLVGVVPSAEAAARSAEGADALALYLEAQYPGDIGCWCGYFLNVAELAAGEALYLDANLPHAYIKGQGVEIMATSDNVVRAGLTPKLRDVATLCDMLDYVGKPAEVLTGEPVCEHTKSYAGTADDFRLMRFAPGAAKGRVTLPANPGPQIVLGVAGAATLNTTTVVAKGSVLFCAAGQRLSFEPTEDGTQIFIACCNQDFFTS
jgi:mannose-6-phosphate isomerase